MQVYDFIVTLNNTDYLLGTIFDRDFAEFVCSIAAQAYPEFNLIYETRDISQSPRVLEYPELGIE